MSLRLGHARAVLACITLSAAAPAALSCQQPGPDTTRQTPPKPEVYRQLAEGVMASSEPVFATDSLPNYRVQILNLVVGPNKSAPRVPLDGAALMELRSGTLEVTINGRTTRREIGATWFVPAGAKVALRNLSEVAIIRTTVLALHK
jgi:hypothetical protein